LCGLDERLFRRAWREFFVRHKLCILAHGPYALSFTRHIIRKWLTYDFQSSASRRSIEGLPLMVHSIHACKSSLTSRKADIGLSSLQRNRRDCRLPSFSLEGRVRNSNSIPNLV
jgi:hypothetical protein